MRVTLLAALAAVLLSGSAAMAQGRTCACDPLRVRVTGAKMPDLPDEIGVGDTVLGGTVVEARDQVVRVRIGADRVLTIPRRHMQLAGEVVALEQDALLVRLDKRTNVDTIPLRAIRRVEVLVKVVPPHRRVFWSVITAIGSFYGTVAVSVSQCFRGPCSSLWNVFVFGTTAAATAGVAYALRNERSETVSFAELSARLAARLSS